MSAQQTLAVQPQGGRGKVLRKVSRRALIYGVILLALVLALFPFFWMLSSSFKPNSELFARNQTFFPVAWTLENYIKVWRETDFPRFFLNSFIVATITTVGSVFISLYAAYALARIRFPGRYLFGLLLLITQMFPPTLLVIPLFVIIQRLGLFNTHFALIIAYLAFSLPFTIWMLRGFFEAIPEQLEDAATIDGTSQLGAFHRIILPLSGPGIAAVSMYAFIRAWNEFLFALVFLQSSRLFTLPLGIASFMEEFSFRWDLLMAGAGIISLPILFFFLLMQRFIIEGLVAGAVKG